ncbi:hypothetical protein HGO38_11765 [Rhizobium sp. CG5]|uniref:hypothetical protein n=1 Tax=Rhizobium sp. CG5 TaxID=2726076 RepID=UPI002034509B|nr:hypothetical protein [Rhizobium sp. CG5]MCM2474149.1 hypothetical protein [Rhizobium sp. CG5]
MFAKAKVVALAAFLIVVFGYPFYSVLFHGLIYVKRSGWRTYEEAPVRFIFNAALSCVAFVGVLAFIAFLVWARKTRRERALERLPPPLIKESYISVHTDQNTERRKDVKMIFDEHDGL